MKDKNNKQIKFKKNSYKIKKRIHKNIKKKKIPFTSHFFY